MAVGVVLLGPASTAFAALEASRTELQFGHQADHTTSPFQSFKITNTGPDPVEVIGGDVIGCDFTFDRRFPADAEPGFESYVPAGGSFTVVVTFHPNSDCNAEAPGPRREGAVYYTTFPEDQVTVWANGTVVQNSQKVDVIFEPGYLRASGKAFTTAITRVTDAQGTPIAGEELDIQPDHDDEAPRAVVCEATTRGKLLWPWLSRHPDGTRPTFGFRNVRSDANGRLDLKVLAGTVPGAFSLSARIPDGEFSEYALQYLDVRPVDSPQPGEPVATMNRLVQDYFSGDYPRFAAAVGRGGTPLERQIVLLELLALARDENVIPFRGYSFGPIRRSDGRAGILLYRTGTTVRTLGGEVGRGRAVIDVVKMSQAIAGSYGPSGFRPPNFGDPAWEGAIVPFNDWRGSGDPPVVGYAEPQKNEDLVGFGYPERPAIGWAGREEFDACLGGHGGVVAEIHSPVRGVMTTPDGDRIGHGPNGPLVEVPGAFAARERGDRPAVIVAPEGRYTLKLTGTDAGKATLVLHQPDVRLPSVFTFTAEEGARGTLTVPAEDAPQRLSFDGETVRPTSGVGLRVAGIPRELEAGRRTLSATVTDQFGRPVPGAILRVGDVRASTDSRGRGELSVDADPGELKVIVEGIDHRRKTVTVTVN